MVSKRPIYNEMMLFIELNYIEVHQDVQLQNIDLNRVPQVIQEASCHTSHSCRALEGSFSLETIPITLRVPVLKKNPACFPATGYSTDYELITVACLCALSRGKMTEKR
uniref:Uncharacterized protein n=1 Tax=Periophthalmus magnuspinnatus TaxID=409849 RepID=A0A3B4A2L1_9GOBI